MLKLFLLIVVFSVSLISAQAASVMKQYDASVYNQAIDGDKATKKWQNYSSAQQPQYQENIYTETPQQSRNLPIGGEASPQPLVAPQPTYNRQAVAAEPEPVPEQPLSLPRRSYVPPEPLKKNLPIQDYYCEYDTLKNDTISTVASKFHTAISTLLSTIVNPQDLSFNGELKLFVPILYHTIEQGETVSIIAAKYGVTNSEIEAMNAKNLIVNLPIGENVLLPILDATRKTVLQFKATAERAFPAIEPAVAPVNSNNVSVKTLPSASNAIKKSKIPLPVKKPDDYSLNDAAAQAKNAEVKPAMKAVQKPVSELPNKPAKAVAVQANEGEFIWPIKGKILNHFGEKGQINDKGMSILTPIGSDIKASADGTVIYSGSEIAALGELIIIRHNNNFLSIYGCNSELLVKKNDMVKQGQVIAKSGSSGDAKTPQLYFSMRKNDTESVDPELYLVK
jgi:murein DD-endopeptidase MepM/ murein hydrolase activator NlpD